MIPSMRQGSHFLCYAYLSDENQDEQILEVKQFANEIYDFGMGSYTNEGQYDISNFQEAFWGSTTRYNRLLSIKDRWDPAGMFACHHCVGSDRYDLSDFRTLSFLPERSKDCSNAGVYHVSNLSVISMFVIFFFRC